MQLGQTLRWPSRQILEDKEAKICRKQLGSLTRNMDG
jgi:hypothetical protein